MFHRQFHLHIYTVALKQLLNRKTIHSGQDQTTQTSNYRREHRKNDGLMRTTLTNLRVTLAMNTSPFPETILSIPTDGTKSYLNTVEDYTEFFPAVNIKRRFNNSRPPVCEGFAVVLLFCGFAGFSVGFLAVFCGYLCSFVLRQALSSTDHIYQYLTTWRHRRLPPV